MSWSQKQQPESYEHIRKHTKWFLICLCAFLIFSIIYIVSSEFDIFKEKRVGICDADCHMHRCRNAGWYDAKWLGNDTVWECYDKEGIFRGLMYQ
jgi:hypothetical protein